MKKRKSQLLAKIVIIMAGIVFICFLALLAYDKLSDKTKIYKDVIAKLQNELSIINNEYFSYGYDSSKSFSAKGKLTDINTNGVIELAGIYKDYNNYEGSIKINDNDITYSLQNNELYLKQSDNIYKFNLKEEELINIKNNVNNYISLSNDNFEDIISDIGSISDILDNKNITKKRIKMDINSKNTLVTAYSYKLNKEIISKLLKNINLDDLDLENNEYYVNIYTKFKKIKKIEIKDIVTVNINNDNIVIDYQIESSSFKINYDKVNKNIDFITYLDNVKVSEYNVAKTDSLNINLKLYNDGDIAKELKITLNKNDVDNGINYIISINGNYKLDILLSYDVNNLIDVSNNRVLSEEEVNEVNKYIYDSLSNMNIFQIFSY
mgnify:CR=1 FL=1